MKYAVSLIDKASKLCGGDAALSRRLKISRAAVSLMRSGERAVTPEIAAELADIAGEDARQALIDAVIERNAGTPKGALLREILGKGLAAGVVAMLAISYTNESRAAMTSIANNVHKNSTSYTSYLLRLALRAAGAIRYGWLAVRAALAYSQPATAPTLALDCSPDSRGAARIVFQAQADGSDCLVLALRGLRCAWA